MSAFSESDRISGLKYLFDRLDRQIRNELDLIGHRMAVLCVSQAFFFSAFATATNMKSSLQKLLLYLIPILGILLALILEVSLLAALSVIDKRKDEREHVRRKMRKEFETGGLGPAFFKEPGNDVSFEVLGHVKAGSLPHRFGNYPYAAIAPVLAVTWGILVANIPPM